MITRSLYHSAKKADIDDEVIVEFARVFGFEIDFQRDIRKNDIFQIVYEKFVDDDGELQKNGRIIYAYMKNNGRDYSLYYFKDKNNKIGYFFPDGKSVEKALMKTPINGARLSSKFGMRKHPILGYNKMHKGTDFAARRGTPIMASGSGVVGRLDGLEHTENILGLDITRHIKLRTLISVNLEEVLKKVKKLDKDRLLAMLDQLADLRVPTCIMKF